MLTRETDAAIRRSLALCCVLLVYRAGSGVRCPSDCPLSTPTHRNTWGSLKALYR
jgi:hypothetical protein